MNFQPGDLIRNYRVLGFVGEGGMGRVYLAEEEPLGRKVAIKVLDPSVTHQEHFRQRFIDEARILSNLHHPNIVGLFSFFMEDGGYLMIMEYAGGQTLRDLIAKTGPIPEQRTRHILRQIAEAMYYAHAKSVVHRDIKPSNIMISDQDELKILDFGIARFLSDPHKTLTGDRLGTVYYMSPEQVRSPRDVDSRSDIYSAGVLLFEMLTGRLPFNSDTNSNFLIEKEIVERPLPHPRQYYPYMSDVIVSLMNSMTSKDPDRRPSAAEIIRALDTGSWVGPPEPKPKPVLPAVAPAPSKKKSSGSRAALTIFLILALIGGAGFGVKKILDVNPFFFEDLFNRNEGLSELVVEEEEEEGPSEEELEAERIQTLSQEAESAVREIGPHFMTIAGNAIDYYHNSMSYDYYNDEYYSSWPGSLDEFDYPERYNTDKFRFSFSDGVIRASSTSSFAKPGVEIYYSIERGEYGIHDPDPSSPPEMLESWLGAYGYTDEAADAEDVIY